MESDGGASSGRAPPEGSTADPARVVVFDPATGREKPWRDIAPENAAGIHSIPGLAIAPNGAYFYNYFRVLSTMYLGEGVK